MRQAIVLLLLALSSCPALAPALVVQQGALSLEFLEPTFALVNASLFGGKGIFGPRPRWTCYPWSPVDLERIRNGAPPQQVRFPIATGIRSPRRPGSPVIGL
jgi:hypothetical protein